MMYNKDNELDVDHLDALYKKLIANWYIENNSVILNNCFLDIFKYYFQFFESSVSAGLYLTIYFINKGFLDNVRDGAPVIFLTPEVMRDSFTAHFKNLEMQEVEKQ